MRSIPHPRPPIPAADLLFDEPTTNAGPEILTVTEITHLVKSVIEETFPMVAIRGELSNVRPASSGHVYLTMKDEGAQLSGVMWRSAASRLRFELQDGLEVVAVGNLDVYPPRGGYQLIIREMLPQGMGPLELAFRQMREKLEAEGLFDPERKQPLPQFPRTIAIVTSPTGAAVRDILQVLTRRWPVADIKILPVAVQGDRAAPQIATAVERLPKLKGVDVAIVGRGGGSLEDLWPFNEERVARAIAKCPVPIISAVGHEIDVTISDLVADRRALTPSEAAELVAPDATEWRQRLGDTSEYLRSMLQNRIDRARLTLDDIANRRVFRSPLETVREKSQQLDDLTERLRRGMMIRVDRARGDLERTAAALDALSPLKTLARGYSITQKVEGDGTKHLLRSADEVTIGDELETRLPDGSIRSRVESSS